LKTNFAILVLQTSFAESYKIRFSIKIVEKELLAKITMLILQFEK